MLPEFSSLSRLEDLIIFTICEISVCRHGVFEAFAVLGCYTAYVGSCLPTFRDSLSVPYPKIKHSLSHLYSGLCLLFGL